MSRPAPSHTPPRQGRPFHSETGGVLQGLLLLLLLFLVLAVGAFLYKVRTGPAATDPRVEKIAAELQAEEDKARVEWQGRIDETRTELLVLQNENERLKEKAGSGE